jgi:NADH dehydrogenase FAD-containing subunit
MLKLISIVAIDKYDIINCSKLKPKIKPNVLVLGNGWAGSNFSSGLDKSKYNLTIVDKNDYFLETHKMSSNYNPIKQVHIPNSKFIKDKVKEIDTKNKLVILSDMQIKYDYLVFALGSRINTFNIPGVDTHCYFYKTIDDLKLISELKNTTVSIIGGGVAGIELGYKIFANNQNISNIKIIEAQDILPGFSKITIDKIKKDLDSKGIRLELNCKVNEISELNSNSNIKYAISTSIDGEQVIFYENNIIWTGGIKPHELKPDITPDVFIIGDNSALEPRTAQKAKQEGKWLAKYFNNGFDDAYANFKFKSSGKIIHTNDGFYIEICDKCTIFLPKYFDWIIYKIIDMC